MQYNVHQSFAGINRRVGTVCPYAKQRCISKLFKQMFSIEFQSRVTSYLLIQRELGRGLLLFQMLPFRVCLPKYKAKHYERGCRGVLTGI